MNVKGKLVLQVLHRANFPKFCKSVEDIEFGFVVYFPTGDLQDYQIIELKAIVNEIGDIKRYGEASSDYFLVDCRTFVNVTSYYVDSIIKKIFKVESESQVFLDLIDQGPNNL